MQKHQKQNLLFFVIGFSVLGFVIGETIGQELEKNMTENNSHKAFGLIDTTVHPPIMGSIPPNYWYVPQTNTASSTTINGFQVVGLQLSGACIAALKAHSVTNCPTYKDVVYADNSNTRLSGGFGYVNGFYERLPNFFKQNIAYYYSLHRNVVLVDPPQDIADKIPMIQIYNVLPTFADKYQDLNSSRTNSTNGFKTLHQYRYTQDCRGLTAITFSKAIVNDTISYIQSGCTKTNLNTLVIVPNNTIQTDPTKSALWQFQQAMNLEKKTVATKDCRYVKCDASVSGKKW